MDAVCGALLELLRGVVWVVGRRASVSVCVAVGTVLVIQRGER